MGKKWTALKKEVGWNVLFSRIYRVTLGCHGNACFIKLLCDLLNGFYAERVITTTVEPQRIFMRTGLA